MPALAARQWVPERSETYIQNIATQVSEQSNHAVADRLAALIAENSAIHDTDCINLNPATNVLNPRAEVDPVSWSPHHLGSRRRA